MLLRARDLLVRQPTQVITAMHGHLAEFGIMGAKGREHALKLMSLVDDAETGLSASRRSVLPLLIEQLRSGDIQVALRTRSSRRTA
jgi:transposase